MRVVLDVNVWISGLLWRGIPSQILFLAQNQQLTVFASEPLLYELKTRLVRPKFADKIRALNLTVDDLMEVVEDLVQMCPTILVEVPQLRDQDDAKILAAGVSAGVDVIVTGDLDLLTLGQFQNIAILTPQNLIDRYFRPA